MSNKKPRTITSSNDHEMNLNKASLTIKSSPRLPPEIITEIIEWGIDIICYPFFSQYPSSPSVSPSNSRPHSEWPTKKPAQTVPPRWIYYHSYDDLQNSGLPPSAQTFVKNCSLVSKEWSGSAKRLLYRWLFFMTQSKIQKFSTKDSVAKSFVRSISLDCFRWGDAKDLPAMMKMLFRSVDDNRNYGKIGVLENLRRLELQLSWTVCSNKMDWDPICEVISESARNVTSLELSGAPYTSSALLPFGNLIKSLKNLKELNTDGAALSSMNLGDPLTDPEVQSLLSRLESLTINHTAKVLLGFSKSFVAGLPDIISSPLLKDLKALDWRFELENPIQEFHFGPNLIHFQCGLVSGGGFDDDGNNGQPTIPTHRTGINVKKVLERSPNLKECGLTFSDENFQPNEEDGLEVLRWLPKGLIMLKIGFRKWESERMGRFFVDEVLSSKGSSEKTNGDHDGVNNTMDPPSMMESTSSVADNNQSGEETTTTTVSLFSNAIDNKGGNWLSSQRWGGLPNLKFLIIQEMSWAGSLIEPNRDLMDICLKRNVRLSYIPWDMYLL